MAVKQHARERKKSEELDASKIHQLLAPGRSNGFVQQRQEQHHGMGNAPHPPHAGNPALFSPHAVLEQPGETSGAILS